MVGKLNKLLAKIGLNESEQTLVVKALIISTLLCGVAVTVFWAFTFVVRSRTGAEDIPVLGADAYITSSNVSDFDLSAHEFTATRYMQTGQAAKALPHLQRIAAMRRGEAAAYNALDLMVKVHLELGEFERAYSIAGDLLLVPAVAADNAAAVSLLVRKGIALYHLRRFEESAEVLRNVLERDPRNADALCFMGQMEAAAQTRSPAAEQFFRRALEASPDHVETHYQFARYFENNGNYKRARELLHEALAKDPLNVRAHARLGMVYFYMRQAEPALKSYQTALALNPYDYNTRYNLGELYRTLLNDNVNALKEFVTALERNPKHSEANFKAGLICIENGMFKEAIRYFEAGLENNRGDIRRLLQLAAAYERIGDRRTALSVYYEITDIDPLHSIALQKIRTLSREE